MRSEFLYEEQGRKLRKTVQSKNRHRPDLLHRELGIEDSPFLKRGEEKKRGMMVQPANVHHEFNHMTLPRKESRTREYTITVKLSH